MESIRVAVAQYPVEQLASFDEWKAKLFTWVEKAAISGAQLLLFPEYAAMELARIDMQKAFDLHASLDLVMSLGEQIDDLHRQLAIQFDVSILGGSRPCRNERGAIVNRAYLFCADGRSGHQDKIMMTRFEREVWGISPGDCINVMDTPVGRVGMAICYDAEFPLIARAQAEAGAQIILVPSATDTMQGYWRVRIGAQARALENQCYVIQAPTVGTSPWLPALEENFGSAAIYGPPDGITPDNGIFAIGECNRPQWLFGDIAMGEVAQWRDKGTVLPFRHWPEQNIQGPVIASPTSAQDAPPLIFEVHDIACVDALPHSDRSAE